MILTNEQMFESLATLSKLEETGMLGYAIARNRQKIAAEIQEYSKQRDELLMKFGTDIGDGKFHLLPEDAARFYEALRPFNELTVDVPVMKISVDVFCSGSLTSSQMCVLSWMVEETENERAV